MPYFFPDTFFDGNEDGAVAELNKNWLTARRAIMRKPIDKMGFGGYLSLAAKFPKFVDRVAEIADEFKTIYDALDNKKPYCRLKVGLLNAWGQKRSRMSHMVAHELWYQQIYSYQGILEAISGLPVDIEFLSFDDVKNGVNQSIDVLINAGDAFSDVLKSVSGLSDLRFMVHTGDVVEYSKYQSYWTNMLNANIKYLSKIPVMTISGNHETTYKNGVNETFNRFNYKIPQQQTDLGFYYSFSYANVKFIMLNTNRLDNLKLTADQYNWLENELKNKTEKWTIVTMHNPIYSVGKYGSDTGNNAIARSLTEQLSGLFARCKVDVILQGHDHMISRTHPINTEGKATGENVDEIDGINYINNPDGVIYVMNGPAGNQARSEIFGHDESLYAYAQASQPSSWAEFEVSGDRLTVKVKTAHAGSSADIVSWGIKKSA